MFNVLIKLPILSFGQKLIEQHTCERTKTSKYQMSTSLSKLRLLSTLPRLEPVDHQQSDIPWRVVLMKRQVPTKHVVHPGLEAVNKRRSMLAPCRKERSLGCLDVRRCVCVCARVCASLTQSAMAVLALMCISLR